MGLKNIGIGTVSLNKKKMVVEKLRLWTNRIQGMKQIFLTGNVILSYPPFLYRGMSDSLTGGEEGPPHSHHNIERTRILRWLG